MDLNRTAIGIAAGVAGTLFIGYCIYFDHKRRKDPEYKKKVRERRRKIRKVANSSPHSSFPNLHDQAGLEQYFTHEVQLGETAIERGDFEGGAEHLANAVIVCAEPTKLLHVLQTSLPTQVFSMLIYKMHEIGVKSRSKLSGSTQILGSINGTSNTVDRLDAAGDASSVLIDSLD